MNIKDTINKISEITKSNAYAVNPKNIVFNPIFRDYCKENRCGLYGKSYMCPPYVGTVDEVCQKVKSFDNAIFYQTISSIDSFTDKVNIQLAENNHNKCAEEISKFIKENYSQNILNLATKCPYCEECAIIKNEPCRYKDKARSCLSAYCVDVKDTAQKLHMPYFIDEKHICFFGMVLFS